jgi:peptidoglycan/LPS O-acetylase OafA/YrhL
LQTSSAIYHSYPRRYASLDAWRGIASLSVLVWHRYWLRTTVTNGFWLGVQLFFVISGYCIAAAVHNSLEQGLPFRQFMRRRMRRIAVPYLASLALALIVKLGTSADLFNGSHSLSPFSFWLRNLTLTQWSYLTARWIETGDGLATPWFNPTLLLGVHWSLNYEEQFYILCGLLLILQRHVRSAMMVVAFTGGVAFLNFLWPGRITGLFVDYWLQFFCGVLVFARLCRVRSKTSARALDAFLFIAAIALVSSAFFRGEFPLLNDQVQFYGQLAVCAVYALLLVVLRHFDPTMTKWRPVRILGFVGRFSYSLYLVHRPVLEALDPASHFIQQRFGWAVADFWVLSLVLLSAYAFYRVFEKPFLNPALERTPRPALVVASSGVEGR